ncbi:MAG: triphosphoribosyl-dephospho-CoA synthase CitG, partial [Spirochaetales bacterium]|nr:triphosphoribosyl-dephospho-CoA synthase CitG [Spirochaetales bacterium]
LAYYKIEVAKNLPQDLPEVKTLLTIMESNEDTNVLSRTKNYAALFYVNEKAKEALQALEEDTQEGLSSVYDLDRDFIEKNISPGGSADLLALTFIFYDLERL